MSCKISLIAAMSRNRVIGRNNAIPWRLPAEMKWFKSVTMGKPVLMGRKTYESIGRPLPGRHNIVLTGRRDYTAEGCTVVHSIEEAITAAGDDRELMVIGGANLYAQMLPLADCMYLTVVSAEIEGDTSFPLYSEEGWTTTQETFYPADEKNPYDFTIKILHRRPRRRASSSDETHQ
jgi:dihydrofolate reductase